MKTKLKDYWHYNEEIYIHEGFVRFIEDDLAPQAQISKKTFWDALKRLVIKFSKENERILLRRKELQNRINTWYFNNRSSIRDIQKYKKFLKNIGYLIDQGADFRIDTTNIDDEISEKPAPQLVVPVDNARFAINAANARWGSLYDALYSTDVIGSVAQSTDFDHERANQVISWTKSLLDEVLPIRSHSWSDLTAIKIENHELHLYDNLGEVFLEYKDLYHYVSLIKGKLKKKVNNIDIIKAMMPGGSVIGCPKISTLNLLNHQEKENRNIYTGSFGFIKFNGDMRFNIIIRSILNYKGISEISVASGVVIDSNANHEFNENFIKAKALIDLFK